MIHHICGFARVITVSMYSLYIFSRIVGESASSRLRTGSSMITPSARFPVIPARRPADIKAEPFVKDQSSTARWSSSNKGRDGHSDDHIWFLQIVRTLRLCLAAIDEP